MDAITAPPPPRNEPVCDHAPGSAERADLLAALDEFAEPRELPAVIGDRRRPGSGPQFDVRAPHDHRRVLAVSAAADADDARLAVQAALAAAVPWRETPFDERAAVLLRAAELLAGPWRARMNAATMLGQGKTIQQAEIDAACELIDFWRFNVTFARQLLAEQPPAQAPGVWNRTDHRPLEGFVWAITPFNFTSIAGNLPTAPALMGNVVIWKPSPTQQLAASLTLDLLFEAGLPPGVINLLPGRGPEIAEVLLAEPELAGIHFTGSTETFQQLWRTVGERIAGYRTYPRLVGETGGKDFVIAHPSADPQALVPALLRGAFEYSGQKCSAASRAYLPESLWRRVRDELAERTEALSVGAVTDLSAFTSAVIDRPAFDRCSAALRRAHATDSISVLAGGTADDEVGWFVRPTVLHGTDPRDEMFSTEYFGPILSVAVYPDDRFEQVLREVDTASPYGLTGAVFARDRAALHTAQHALRFTAGNFYLNDKPTGAVVGQQPFGGSRASGTNDKAGSVGNLARWTSPRTIKETFLPAPGVTYPHQG
ncbi:L-glutamate gamma-semialdehyde dehydrogenase [Nakamurella leprariae]|uniref:L-glutamate gamma-semialdehyde dehydrogenase n=1 Tax=Nakamurella leprariae TaxID=2803911 RepID=A0A938YIU4_9ACTN|nr:L-glutamate gamma-semialdehyde dehydrogenase [Nakamurella leprariae]MBM9469102.1 L-glutamate gamma-semialdehyde dehydrogenase [Nakamurella leprariae]